MKNILIEKLRLFRLKHTLNQKQLEVKSPQMPLIQVGQVSIPNCLENQGLLCVGSSRDRSIATLNLVRQLRRRTDFRGIILDRNGELIKRFFDPALDTIFAPNDDRSIAWCHKSEPVSGEDLALSLIDIDPADPIFYEAAIDLLAIIFDNTATSDEVWQVLFTLNPQELQIYLFGSDRPAAEKIFEPDCDRSMVKLIKSVTQFYCYLKDESKFSFYNWGNNDRPGWLFIPWFEGDTEDVALMPLRKMAIDLALQGLLARKEVVYHRTAVIIPDLSYLKPYSLPRFIGECYIGQCQGFPLLGVESISSVIKKYGQLETRVIFGSMQVRLLFNKWLEGERDQAERRQRINCRDSQVVREIINSISVNEPDVASGQAYLKVRDRFAKVNLQET